jgi:uncharacterized protein with FMN-binding domain
MRKRAIAMSIVSSAAVVVMGWQIGAQAQIAQTAAEPVAGEAAASPTPSSDASPPAANPSPSTTSPSATATPSATPIPSPSSAASDGTYAGSVVSTRYGNVQVQITVSNGTITDVTALQLTNDGGRSIQISNEAAPILRKEVLTAQSANVDSVSGATYTSDGYLTSLQAALDRAGL